MDPNISFLVKVLKTFFFFVVVVVIKRRVIRTVPLLLIILVSRFIYSEGQQMTRLVSSIVMVSEPLWEMRKNLTKLVLSKESLTFK